MVRERIDPLDAAALATDGRVVCQQHVARYGFALPYVVDRTVIDVASGTGYGSAMMLLAGATHVTCIDQNPGAYAARMPTPNWTALSLDLNAPGSPLNAHICVSFETIEHVDDPVAFLRWTCASAPVLLASVPCEEVAGGNPFHKHTGITPPQFQRWLNAAGWHDLEWFAQEHESPHVVLMDLHGGYSTMLVHAVRA